MVSEWVAAAGVVLTLVVLEAVLSFDNAAILTVLSRRLHDPAQRRRALNYGLIIAYVLRVAAIGLAFILIKMPVFLTFGGLYLVFMAAKHLLGLLKGHDDLEVEERRPWLSMFGVPAFAAVVIEIGIVDLVFALDQVVAALTFTQNLWLIIVAASVGLVSLRVLAPFIGRLMDWLPVLEHIAYGAVGFVGLLLVLEHPLVVDHALVHVPKAIKIAVTLSFFAIPVAVKLVFKVPRSQPKEFAPLEQDFELPVARHRGEDLAGVSPKP